MAQKFWDFQSFCLWIKSVCSLLNKAPLHAKYNSLLLLIFLRRSSKQMLSLWSLLSSHWHSLLFSLHTSNVCDDISYLISHISYIDVSQGQPMINYVCWHWYYSQVWRTRIWSEGLVRKDLQDSTGPPGPPLGPTAPRTTTATGRGSPGRCSWEVCLLISMKVRPVSWPDLTWPYCVADEITASFRRFGPLVVDWPHKAESKSYFPPKGYAFLLFQVNGIII